MSFVISHFFSMTRRVWGLLYLFGTLRARHFHSDSGGSGRNYLGVRGPLLLLQDGLRRSVSYRYRKKGRDLQVEIFRPPTRSIFLWTFDVVIFLSSLSPFRDMSPSRSKTPQIWTILCHPHSSPLRGSSFTYVLMLLVSFTLKLTNKTYSFVQCYLVTSEFLTPVKGKLSRSVKWSLYIRLYRRTTLGPKGRGGSLERLRVVGTRTSPLSGTSDLTLAKCQLEGDRHIHTRHPSVGSLGTTLPTIIDTSS